MKPVKLSIVVPTRNRAPYLHYCLESCLASDDKNLEVIVSDNNSTDDTRQVASHFSDPRLRYHHTGASLSMRQNFEFALSKTEGDYILFIGDDDGFLKNGLASLREVIERYQPDIVNWRHTTYKWPTDVCGGILKFRYRDFFGALYEENPQELLTAFCKADVTSFRDAAHIYHGAVSRRLVERISEKSGGYFMGQIPDVYTALANLAMAESFLWIRSPVSIAGESPKSNGAATTTAKIQSKDQKDIAKDFTNLAEQDEVLPEVDAYVYACLVRVNEKIADNRLKIDHATWYRKILESNQNLAPSLHEEQQGLINALFAKTAPNLSLPPPVQPSSHSDGVLKKPRNRFLRPDLETVEDVRDWVDNVMGGAYLPKKNRPLALMAQLGYMAKMRIRAAFIKKRRTS